MIITEDIRQQFLNTVTMMSCIRLRERYAFIIKSLMDIANGRDITPDVFMEWINWLLNVREVSVNTTSMYRSSLRAFFNWAIMMNYCQKNPCVWVRNLIMTPSDRQPITVQEYIRLQQVTQYKQKWHYMYYMILVAWNTGMRAKDIALLKWENVDLLKRCIRFKPYKTARFNRWVEIPIMDELYYYLAEKKLKASLTIYVNTNAATQALEKGKTGKGVFDQTFRYIAAKAELPPGKSLHCFRHSFITRCLEGGVSPAMIADMVGHSSLEQIMTYQHVSLESKRNAIKAV